MKRTTCTPCPDGRYSSAGSLSCALCDAGYYCTSPCSPAQQKTCGTDPPPGYVVLPASRLRMDVLFGALELPFLVSSAVFSPLQSMGGCCGAVDHTLVARCCHRYACEPGSSTSTGMRCPIGKYSGGGGTPCTNCTAGRVCPAGSETASPSGSECPAGRFALSGATSCSLCMPGYFCPTGSMNGTAVSCGTSPPPGYSCSVPGSNSSAGQPCPPGTCTRVTLTQCSAIVIRSIAISTAAPRALLMYC